MTNYRSARSYLGALAILLTTASQGMAQSCLNNNSMIFGELQEVVTRDLRGQQIRTFHIVLPRKTCINAPGFHQSEPQSIGRLQLHAVNATDESLSQYIGAKITVRGNFATRKESWHTADAALLQARILKVHDPRNNRAFEWDDRSAMGQDGEQNQDLQTSLQPPVRDMQELDNGERDPAFGPDRQRGNQPFAENRENERPVNSDLRTDMMAFISDVYLKFFQMEPNEIAEHYSPAVDYFNRRDVESAAIVEEKYNQFQRLPQRKYGFLPATLKLRPSTSCDGCFDVSFQYWVEVFVDGRKRWSRNQARLTIETGRETLKIRREAVEQLDHNGMRDLADLGKRTDQRGTDTYQSMY